MKFINSWSSFNKQHDKLRITLRIGFLTILDANIDISAKHYSLMILNLGIKL